MYTLEEMAAEAGTTPEDFNAFLHEQLPYIERFGIHDVLGCEQCRTEAEGSAQS